MASDKVTITTEDGVPEDGVPRDAKSLTAAERALIYGTDERDELAAEQDECARFRS